MDRQFLWWCLSVAVICFSIQDVSSVSSQKDLLIKLFEESSYNSDVRPVAHANESVTVSIDVALEQIIDLKEPDQVLNSKIWMRMEWKDVDLQWDPDDYDGMTIMTIQAFEVWRPDIVLYDNVDQGFGGWPTELVMVDSNGTVYWKFPIVASTTCDVDVASFPFDAQACPLKFGSWLHDSTMIKLDRSRIEGDLAAFKENAEWDVVSLKAIHKKKLFGSAYYDQVTFILAIERKWSFYFFNLLFPCFLLALLATLSFYLPAESGDKISFGVTVLLALSVFLLMIAEKMPPSEDVPLVAWYVIVTLVLLSLSLLLGSIVVNLSMCTADTKPVPAWVRRLVLRYMSQILLMGDLSKSLAVIPEQETAEGKKTLDDSTLRIIRASVGDQVEHPAGSNILEGKPGNNDVLMQELVRDVRSIVGHLEEEREGEAMENDWKRVARVMDKFFMALYLLTTLCIIAATCLDGIIGWTDRLEGQVDQLVAKV